MEQKKKIRDEQGFRPQSNEKAGKVDKFRLKICIVEIQNKYQMSHGM